MVRSIPEALAAVDVAVLNLLYHKQRITKQVLYVKEKRRGAY